MIYNPGQERMTLNKKYYFSLKNRYNTILIRERDIYIQNDR